MSVLRSSVLTADVAVVGGGVAGSSVAAALAQAGLGVVLVEREARFRDRVRGESIHPWGVKQIGGLGLLDVVRAAGAQALPIAQVYVERAPTGGVRWDSADPGSPGEWSVYHPALQSALLEFARDCGVRVLRPARVTQFTRATDLRLDVTTEQADYEVRARLVVGAEGRQSAARRWVGAEVVQDPVHHQVGGCLLDGVALAEDTFHAAGFTGGVVLIFPQGAGRARVYLIANESIVAPLRGHEHVAEFIGQCAAIFPEGAFEDACASGPLAFYPNADVWSDRLCDDRVVLIGDAAGANDPSVGQGLSLCFRDAGELRDELLGDSNWDAALMAYAARRMEYFSVLRSYAHWRALLTTDIGPEADTRRAGAMRAAERDPGLGGFNRWNFLSHGPSGLVADEAARSHYFGEDLDETSAMVQITPALQ
ncbi:MAG TPA: NAD(P)/FAD-dependent oxidoreductase [Thermomicrobiales bacterium]|nr:NAD(P)/FAD-dependent oxidoreductase [Thermomicrobiales bacterium]